MLGIDTVVVHLVSLATIHLPIFEYGNRDGGATAIVCSSSDVFNARYFMFGLRNSQSLG